MDEPVRMMMPDGARGKDGKQKKEKERERFKHNFCRENSALKDSALGVFLP